MKCAIITANVEGDIKSCLGVEEYYIICADGGIDKALEEGITPNMVVGDMDSAKTVPKGIEFFRALPEKDETDTLLCIDKAMEKGFLDIVIVGGTGGRLDHTIANLQTLKYAADKGANVSIKDGKNTAFILKTGSVRIPKENAYLSLFAYTEECMVSVSGVKYPLQSHKLTSSFPLGVSNEFASAHADITVEQGSLLVVLSQK